MKKISLLSLLIISIFSLQAQVTNLNEANAMAQLEQNNLVRLANITPGSSGFQGFENPNLRLKGTPYLSEDWQEGRVRIAEGESSDLGIALNIVDQILYVQLDDGFTAELPNTLLKSLVLEEEEGREVVLEVHDMYAKYGEGPRGYKYYQPLYKGEKYQLWELHTKYLRLEKYIENLGLVRRPNEFRSHYEYWLLDEEGRFQRVKRNEKGILKVLPGRARAIKSILRRQKIDLKSNEGLVQFFTTLEEK